VGGGLDKKFAQSPGQVSGRAQVHVLSELPPENAAWRGKWLYVTVPPGAWGQ
jgi:hypothetical protein